jgi:hypothetical protein
MACQYDTDISPIKLNGENMDNLWTCPQIRHKFAKRIWLRYIEIFVVRYKKLIAKRQLDSSY